MGRLALSGVPVPTDAAFVARVRGEIAMAELRALKTLAAARAPRSAPAPAPRAVPAWRVRRLERLAAVAR